MVIMVLEKNRLEFEKGEFKLKRPYINLTESAIKLVQSELKQTKKYMRENNLKILKGVNDGTITTYTFFHGGYESERRYLNVRLRNRTEELLEMYLMKVNYT